jgi:hypothetical protein
MGTIFPYLRKCAERGWGVVVFNPNQNAAVKPGAEDDEAWFKTREAFLSTAKVMRPIKHLIKIPGSTIIALATLLGFVVVGVTGDERDR